jgi:hypothetical protein
MHRRWCSFGFASRRKAPQRRAWTLCYRRMSIAVLVFSFPEAERRTQIRGRLLFGRRCTAVRVGALPSAAEYGSKSLERVRAMLLLGCCRSEFDI